MGWQWQQVNHMQIMCTSFQTDNHASTSPLSFYRPYALLATQPTASKQWKQCKARKAFQVTCQSLFASQAATRVIKNNYNSRSGENLMTKMGEFHKLFTDDGGLQFKAVDWTATDNTSDWLSCGFTSHSTQNNVISEKPISWLGMEKLNLTQQKHPFTNQKKRTITQNKHKKTKARFSRLLRYPTWKRRGPILV